VDITAADGGTKSMEVSKAEVLRALEEGAGSQWASALMVVLGKRISMGFSWFSLVFLRFPSVLLWLSMVFQEFGFVQKWISDIFPHHGKFWEK